MRLNPIRVRDALFYAGKTQRQLAEETKVSRITINKVCNGNKCSIETAIKVSTALCVPLERLEVK